MTSGKKADLTILLKPRLVVGLLLIDATLVDETLIDATARHKHRLDTGEIKLKA
ncbi:MAG: hypothetical protein AAGB19_00290 [Cyanobacteria bacterium P01_F01_bin.3]